MFVNPPNITGPNLRAFFSTRLLSPDKPVTGALADVLDISENDIYMPMQKHTGTVHIVDDDLSPVVADAVITSRKNILIGVAVADCVPILLYDSAQRVAAAVHAGWRGTAQRIVVNTIERMNSAFSCSGKDISLAIGPCIRVCSYEVGEEVVSGVREATGEGDYYSIKEGRHYIDLSSANMLQAVGAGIPPENIWQSDECTFCSPEKFYSYRYLNGCKGRQGGFIGMW